MRVSLRLVEPGAVDKPARSGVRALLAAADDEFLPAISARVDTMTLPDGTARLGFGVDAYAAALANEEWILAEILGSVVGVISYRRDHLDRRLPDVIRCTYVTTLIVRRDQRRRGIGRSLYLALSRSLCPTDLIGVQTWSANQGHLELLHALGFVLAATEVDARGPGLDTVLFVRAAAAVE